MGRGAGSGDTMTMFERKRAPGPDRKMPARGALRRWLCGFGRDESGVMIAFSIFFLLIILMVAGIGVDLMRFEMTRTRLQATLDRAVLAAADMQQPRDPAEVVQDYLETAGLHDVTLDTPNVSSGTNFRMVDASASIPMRTQFMHMLGVSELSAPALAGAEERIDGIEIALVLDISNSMNWNDRLINLRPAARDFIDTVMALAEPGHVAVSIIPYNTQVNAGAALLRHYDVSTEHDYSHCVDFEAADFNSTSLSPTAPLQRTGHFDYFTYASGTWPPAAGDMPMPVCPTRAGSDITVFETDPAAARDKIDALTAYGNTSIDIGMKWAMTLLDPGTRGVISDMIADGDVHPDNFGRPVDYDEPDVLKVIVVMTDGQNTTQYMLPADRRDGPSDIWYHPASDTVSVYMPRSGPDYFWLSDEAWHDAPRGNHTADPDEAIRLSYPELWAFRSVAQNARYQYGPAYSANGSSLGAAWSDWYSTLPETLSGAQKDTRLQNACGTAKSSDVMIYAIGFEATANGNDQLRNCASSPSHFFDADGVDISDAFQAIAASIAQLRLTQ
ncbi:hypothetical protein FLO80_07890 [Aquicoccus porphyridii]|uniref:Putative Flp pilus-assembly TadG-like N-terminal domain-containing protein n=2 Tax=Aquicoccus porphyridii TaxID=1852029 RepID=A0A5A9ZHJ7_9RHOB|nr:hypothetical protein FLO80_07890 [Aquicoccus porphyridii]RAI53858.1 hypothetical protein DOO74_10565 [Rhodobacteraceae bacterium AsT-22]